MGCGAGVLEQGGTLGRSGWVSEAGELVGQAGAPDFFGPDTRLQGRGGRRKSIVGVLRFEEQRMGFTAGSW